MTRVDERRTVSSDGVRRAAARLDGVAVRTPLIQNAMLNERVGGRVLFKTEVLQRGGSFKLRGAHNCISQLSDEACARGVIAWSSGNHALGVAMAARRFNAPATIVMPKDAPALKIENVREAGAEIVFYDRYKDDREAIAMAMVEEKNLALVPSFDHSDIIEGQGTVALEVVEQAAEMGLRLDAMVIPCGGGGLTAGCATILADVSPATEVIIAEPEGYDETWASIRAGKRLRVDISRRTICDAIATPTPGEITFSIMQKLVKGGASLSEDEIGEAVIFGFKNLKLVIEPGGAAALAAVLAGKVDAKGRTICVVLSGGNVDPVLFASLLGQFG